MLRRKRDWLFAFLLILPAIIILGKIFIYPIYQTIIWSFYHYNLMDGTNVKFIGLKNYKDIFHTSDFWLAFRRTWVFTLVSVIFELGLGFFCALLLNQKFKGQMVFRAFIIIPWALLTLVNGLLWDWIYQPGYGAFSVILHKLHLLGPHQNPVWLATSDNVILFAVIADVWKMTPFMTLMLLAGFQSIPDTLYEAAMLDGAGFWKKIRYVTIPQLMPTILIAAVLRTVGAFKVYDVLTVFTGDATTSISYLTFNYGFRYFYLGKASSMALIQTCFVLVLAVVYIILLKRNTENQ